MKTLRDLHTARGTETECSTCGRLVPTSQPVLLRENSDGDLLGIFHRTCIAGAERIARERPGELDLTVVYKAGAAVSGY